MQYLLKIESVSAPRWRLIAVDGEHSLAYTAELMALAFGYAAGARAFTLPGGKQVGAGLSGRADSAQALQRLDSLKLETGDVFTFSAAPTGFLHQVKVMKKEEHLYCLMPSCLVGAGLVPPELAEDEAALAEYAQSEEAESLDLRECTKRMRAFAEQQAGQSAGLKVPFASA